MSQAWIEASTKGAVLLFTAAEVEGAALSAAINPAAAGLLGGMTGGIAQAYATMGTPCLQSTRACVAVVFPLLTCCHQALQHA